jgi:GntR family transcriptional regulator/MocR family aminotransferase
MKKLVSRAAKLGVLIEPVKDYYYLKQNYKSDHSQSCFRLGVSSLDESKIRAGIAKLAKLIREFTSTEITTLDVHHFKPMNKNQLFKKLAGATLICQTVYGEPCRIDIKADGKLIGQAGDNHEDCDKGRWWIEEGCWFRQWQNWSYGEQAGFYVTIEDQHINWFNQNGRLVDTAIIQFADSESNNQQLA